jgi:PAS domain S-box-containing protein
MAFSSSRLDFLCRRANFLLPLALALLLLSTTSALQSWKRHAALVADEQMSRDIVEHDGRLLTALIDAETGQRGFVLTGQEGYLLPFSRGEKAAPVELAALQHAVVSPEQRARAAAIGPLMATKLSELRLTIELRKSSGFDAALKRVGTNEGKNAMDRIRTLCEQIQAFEDSRLIEKTRGAEAEEKESIVVTVAGSSLLFVLLALALFTIKRVERQRARLMDEMHQRNEILRHQALLLDMASDTIFIRDGEDRITYWNQGAERLYGWSKEEALGHLAHTLLNTQFPEALESIVATLLATGRWEGESQHTRRDGTLVTVASSWTLQRDASNRPGSVIEMSFDITARKEAEQERRTTSERLNAILNGCHDGIIVFEAIRDNAGVLHDLRFAMVNPATERLTRTEARDLIGRTLLEKFPSATSDGLLENLSRVIREDIVLDVEYYSLSGRIPRWYRISGVKLNDGLAVSYHEITQRKQSETELKSLAGRLGSATQALQAGIWDWELHTNLMLWDDRMHQIYEIPGSSQVDYQAWAGAVAPEDLPQAEAALQRSIASKSQGLQEFRIILKNGALRYIQNAYGPILDDDGHVVRLVGVNIDVTERKLNEARERQLTNSLKIANQELEEFAYVASHDLKAPLRVIDNASKWLEEDLQEHLTDETRDCMNLLRGRVKRMEKLLDDLLEYARIGRATDGRYTETVTGDELMDYIQKLLSLEGLTLKVSPRFANIQVCLMPLQHILMNLIGNAAKHHHRKTGCIEVRVEDNGAYYAFAVQDDGPGIPAQFHEQIFKMFQTLRPRDQVEGSGMGLAMVRKNVDVFGGALQLESTEGRGSTFRFTWPKQQQLRKEAA